MNTTVPLNIRLGAALVFCALLSCLNASAFSLLGPTPSWMQATNLWRYRGEIGGPMEKGEEYRRNVNVLTYGFDQSFLDFFGNPGVLAVEQAFATLNRLPPASAINVNRYPTNTVCYNEGAANTYINDLKLATLHTVLEEMGLASPFRYVWTLRYVDDAFLQDPNLRDPTYMSPEQLATYMGLFNFDPVTFQPTIFLSGQMYTFRIFTLFPPSGPLFAAAIPIDPAIPIIPTVADANTLQNGYGLFATGLTRDDVGGIKYLLRYNNVNVESYDPSVQVRFADRRPVARTGAHLGVDKITFVKHRTDAAGGFLPMTFKSAVYILNNQRIEKALATRVVTKPDFLFCGGSPTNDWLERSGTSNWINNSAANNKPGADGPGVIAGQTVITFQTNTVFGTGPNAFHWHWGNISSPTNAVILGP